MKQFQLQNVGMTLNENLFSNISLTISQGDRIGIVGNNGTGKTTLLKCLTGKIEPTEGKIIRPKDLSFAVVEQGIPKNLDHKSLYDVVAESLSPEEKDYNLWKVDIALDILKATQLERSKLFKELSGGWQRLALIARAWISAPDILFLDEPTNHLDIQKILL